MAGSDLANSIPVQPGRDRLDSWKEIALYLNHGVRTVQRWEQEEGLPVHRLAHEKRGTVHAYKRELDQWWKSRASELGGDTPDAAAGPEDQGSFEVPDRSRLEEKDQRRLGKRRRIPLVAAISLTLIIVVAAGIWLFRRGSARKPESLTQITTDSGGATQPALSPDGRLIAYVSDRGDDGGRDLWIQQIQGSQAVRAAKGPVFAPAFSPDSTRIVYWSAEPELGTYEVPALGGQPRLVVPRGIRPRFSPNGRWMSYIVSPNRLLLMSKATGDSRE